MKTLGLKSGKRFQSRAVRICKADLYAQLQRIVVALDELNSGMDRKSAVGRIDDAVYEVFCMIE